MPIWTVLRTSIWYDSVVLCSKVKFDGTKSDVSLDLPLSAAIIVFTCVSYAEARLSYRRDVSVRPSVCPSHAGIVSKRLNLS